MNLFRNWLRPVRALPPQTKSQSLFALSGFSDAVWTSSASGALTREGFARNPVVYRCVRLLSENAASMPWLARQGDAEIEMHPMLDLLRLPGPARSGRQFLETLFGHMLVFGNAYVQAVCADETPVELHLLRPDRVRVVTGADGWPTAYEVGEGERKVRFAIDGEPSPVLHLTLFNPLDDVLGLPPLSPAHMALDIHNTASTWNKALLDNSAQPSGALVYNAPDSGNLTPDQFDRLKAELEEGYGGAARAGRPMLLEGGLDWKAMGFSPKDMDFVEAKNGAARDIALAFGVPPMLLGIPGDATYANYAEANRALWRNTVLPLASRVAEALGAWLSAHFNDDLRLDFDRDSVEALAADREALWKRLNEASFLTVDEKRAGAGYAPAPVGVLATE